MIGRARRAIFSKKLGVILTTVAYLQVNVLWAAAPNLPLAGSLRQVFSSVSSPFSRLFEFRLGKSADEPVFVFHSGMEPDVPDRVPPAPPILPPAPGEPPAPAEGRDLPRGGPVRQAADLRGEAGQFVRDQILPEGRGDLGGLRLADLRIGNLPVPVEVRDALHQLAAASNPAVQVQAGADGSVRLNVAGYGDIIVQRQGDGTIAVRATPAPGAAPAAPRAGAGPAPVAAGPVEQSAVSVAALRGLGFNGAVGNGRIADLRGNGRWITTTDPSTGQRTRRFEGEVSWSTASGMNYTARANADGQVELTREATGTFQGRNVTQNGRVVDVEYDANGRAVASTTFRVGDTETRVDGQLTHFIADGGPILRQVILPQGAPAPNAPRRRRGDRPSELTGSRGDYVIREGTMDSVFRMNGDRVELRTMTDNRNGNVVAERNARGVMVGQMDGVERRFSVDGGPRFDSRTGAAVLSVELIRRAGDVDTLTARPQPGPAAGAAAPPTPPAPANPRLGPAYDGVTFQQTGNGTFQVRADRNGARMAAALSLGTGKTELMQSSNIRDAVFLAADGSEVGRTLDGVRVLGADGQPANRPPMVAITTDNVALRRAYAAIGVVQTAPFSIVRNAQNITGTVRLVDGNRFEGNVNFQMANGATATLNIQNNRHLLTVDNRGAANVTTLQMGAADIEVGAGRQATINLDDIFTGRPPAFPAGVTVRENITVERRNVTNLNQIGMALDARVIGGGLQAWLNPLTGNLQFTRDGVMQIRGQGYSGTVTMREGRADELHVRADNAGPASLIFRGADNRNTALMLPAGRALGVDLQTGAFKGDNLPRMLDGVRLLTRDGIDVTMRANPAAPGGVGVTVNQNFNAYGANIDVANVTARIFNGRIQLDLAAPVNINQRVAIGANAPEAVRDNVQLVRLDVNALGALTGIGHAEVLPGRELVIPGSSVGASGASNPSANPDMSGLATRNVLRQNRDGSEVVTPNGRGPAQVAVTFQDAGGRLRGSVNLQTSIMENVQVHGTGAGINVNGLSLTGDWTINQTAPGDTTMRNDSADARAVHQDSGTTIIMPEANRTLTFNRGALQNNTQLDNVVIERGGSRVLLVAGSRINPRLAATAERVDENRVVPVLAAGTNLSVLGFANADLRRGDRVLTAPDGSVTGIMGRLENGRILFDLTGPLAVRGNPALALDARAGEAPAGFGRDAVVERIGFEVTTGRGIGTGAFTLLEAIQVRAEDPAAPAAGARPGRAAAGGDPAQPNSRATGTAGVTVGDIRDGDGHLTGQRVTPIAGAAVVRVNASFAEPAQAGGAVEVMPNIVSDFADLQVDRATGFFAAPLGQRFDPGPHGQHVVTREVARGNYLVEAAGAGATMTDVTPDGRHRVITAAEGGGAHRLVFQGGQIVEPTQGPRGPGSALTPASDRDTGVPNSAGNFDVRMDAPSSTNLPGGLTLLDSSEVSMQIRDGRITDVTGGLHLQSGDAPVRMDIGREHTLEISANSTLTYAGTESFSNVSAVSVETGRVQYVAGRQRAANGNETLSVIEFTPGQAAAMTVLRTREGAGERRILQEVRQTRYIMTRPGESQSTPLSRADYDRGMREGWGTVRQENVRWLMDPERGPVLYGATTQPGATPWFRYEGAYYVMVAPVMNGDTVRARGRMIADSRSFRDGGRATVVTEDGEIHTGVVTGGQNIPGFQANTRSRWTITPDGGRAILYESTDPANRNARVERASVDFATTLDGTIPDKLPGILGQRLVVYDDAGHPHWARQETLANTFRFETGGRFNYDGEVVESNRVNLAGAWHDTLDTYLAEGNIGRRVIAFTPTGLTAGTVRDFRGAASVTVNGAKIDGLVLELDRQNATDAPVYMVTSNTQAAPGTTPRMGNTFMIGAGSRFTPAAAAIPAGPDTQFTPARSATWLRGSYLLLQQSAGDGWTLGRYVSYDNGARNAGYDFAAGSGGPGGEGSGGVPPPVGRARYRLQGERLQVLEGRVELEGSFNSWLAPGTIAQDVSPDRPWNDTWMVGNRGAMTRIAEFNLSNVDVSNGVSDADGQRIAAAMGAWGRARSFNRQQSGVQSDLEQGVAVTVIVNGQMVGNYNVRTPNHHSWGITRLFTSNTTADISSGRLVLIDIRASQRDAGFQRPRQLIYEGTGTDDEKKTIQYGIDANWGRRGNGLAQTVPIFGEGGAITERASNARVVFFTERDKDGRLFVKETYLTVSDAEGRNSRTYNIFGFGEQQHIASDSRYSDDARNGARDRLMQAYDNFEQFYNTDRLVTHDGRTLTGDDAWRYILVGSGNAMYADYHSQMRPRIGVSDLVMAIPAAVGLLFGSTSIADSMPTIMEEQANKDNAARYAQNNRALIIGEVRNGEAVRGNEVNDRIREHDPYVFGWGTVPRWIDTIPDRIVSWVGRNPTEAAIFTGVFVGLLALQLIPGVGQAVGAWVVGSVGFSATTIFMTGLAAFNIASMINHVRTEGAGALTNGWFWLDVGFALLPGVSQTYQWFRGGAAVYAAARESGVVIKTVAEANEAARALRTLGFAGSEIRGGGQALTDALKSFSAVGIKDSSMLAKFSGELYATARSAGFDGVGRVLYNAEGRAAMRALSSDTVAAAGKAMESGFAKLGAVEFAQAVRTAGLTSKSEITLALKDIAAHGTEGVTESAGKALAGRWAERQVMALMGGGDTAATAGKAALPGAQDLAGSRTVQDAIAKYSAMDPAKLVSAIAGDSKLGTFAEKLFVLGRSIIAQGGDAAQFMKLGGELAQKVGGGALGKVLEGGEAAAGALFKLIGASEKTAGGFMAALTEDGGKIFVGLAKDKDGGARVVEILSRGGERGAELGRNVAVLLNDGGEGVAKMFSTMGEKGAGLLGSRLAADATGAFSKELARVVNLGGAGVGEALGKAFDALSAVPGGLKFIMALSEGGIEGLSHLAQDTTGAFGRLISNPGFERVAVNAATALNEGGLVAASYFSTGSTANIINLLGNESSAVSNLFRGLLETAGNATGRAGERLGQIDEGVAALLRSTAGAGDDVAAAIAKSIGHSIGGAREAVFKGLAEHLSDAAKGAAFGTQLVKGGAEGAVNFSRFVMTAGSKAEYQMFEKLLGKLDDVGQFLAKGLSGEGVANVRQIFRTFMGTGRLRDSSLQMFADFLNEGKALSGGLLSGLTNTENFARGLVGLARSGANGKDIFQRSFAAILASLKAGDPTRAIASVLGVLNGSGARVTSVIANLGKKGAVENLASALEKAAGGSEGALKTLFEFAGKTTRSKLSDVLERALGSLPPGVASAARQKLAALSPSARSAAESLLGRLSASGQSRLLEAVARGNPRALGNLLASLEGRGLGTVVTILNDAAAGAKFVELASTIGEKGAVRLGDLLKAFATADHGVAFFKSLKDVGKFARTLELISEKTFTKVLSIVADLKEGIGTMARILESVDNPAVLSAFFDNLSDVGAKTFARVLNELGAHGAEVIPALFRNLNPAGAKVLAEIFNTVRGEVLISFFSNLTVGGAESFGKLLSSLSLSGREAVVAMFQNLDAVGAKLFAKVLNSLTSVEGLKALFNSLGREGGIAFGKFLNSVPAGSQLEKNVISLLGALNERGGRALGAIFNKGDKAIANLTKLLTDLKGSAAEEFGKVLNGLSSRGARVLADAMAKMSPSSAKNFAEFLNLVGTGKAEVIAKLINNLSGKNGAEILSKLFGAQGEIAKLAALVKEMSANGGAMLGNLLSRFRTTGEAIAFMQKVGLDQVKGLAGFLNFANAKIIKDAMSLMKGDSLTKVLQIFKDGGAEAGAGLARMIGGAGKPGVETLAGLLAKSEGATLTAVTDMLKVFGSGTEDAAKLFGQVLGKLSPTEIANLVRLFESHAAIEQGGAAIGRLFRALAMAKGDPAALAQLFKSGALDGLTAGQQAGLLLRTGLMRGSQLTTDAILARRAVVELLGKSEPGFLRRAADFILRRPGDPYAGDVINGLFVKQAGRAGQKVFEDSEKAVIKDVLSTLLGNQSGLSAAQRNALRATIRANGMEELVPLALRAPEGLKVAVLNGAKEAALGRVDRVIFLWNHPQQFVRLMYTQAFAWSQFGFSGVGSLVPFGYEADVYVDGKFVKEGRGFFFGWVDPITGEHTSDFGRMLGHVFLGWDEAHMNWRVKSAKDMFREGIRMGPLLHTFGVQPSGVSSRIAGRGVGGNAVYGTVRVFGPPLRGLTNRLGWTAGAFEASAFDGSLMQFYSRGLARMTSQGFAESGLGRVSGMMLLGWEGVLPFHIVTMAGHAAGEGLGDMAGRALYGSGEESLDARRDLRHQFSEAGGKLAMFLVPQQNFEAHMASEIMKAGLEARSEVGGTGRNAIQAQVLLRDAVSVANEILGTGGNGRGTVEIRVGESTFRLEARQAQGLRAEAGRVMTVAIAEAAEAARPALVLEDVNLAGRGNGNEFLGQLYEALRLTGSARQTALERLATVLPDIATLNIEGPEFMRAAENHLLEATGMSIQQIAEGASEGRLSARDEAIARRRISGEVDALTPEQVRLQLVDGARAETRDLKSDKARARLESEMVNERLGSRDVDPIEEGQVRADVKDQVSRMSDAQVTGRLQRSAETRVNERVNKNEAGARRDLTNQRLDAENKAAGPAFAVGGKPVAEGTPGAVRITESLRSAAVERHEAAVLQSLSPARLQEVADSEVGTSLRGVGRWYQFRAGEFVVTRGLQAKAQQMVEARAAQAQAAALVTGAHATGQALESELKSQGREVTNLVDQLEQAASRGQKKITINGRDYEVDALLGTEGRAGMTITRLINDGILVLSGRNQALWSYKDGIGSFTLRNFSEFMAEAAKNGVTYAEAGYVLKVAAQINEVAAKFGRGTFKWNQGQLIASILAARGNINMAAGAGKTPIMITRALIEALQTGASESTSVMLISENASSVDNLLGKGGLFDLKEIGKSLGVEVVDLRAELEFARAGNKNGRDYSITDVIQLMREGPDVAAGGARLRRILVVDFDTLGGALSEFKADGFLRAYTDTVVRIFDEVHRVTTDPVTYVIGGGDGKNAENSRASYAGLQALEKATVSREGRTSEAGLSADGKTFRIRGVSQPIEVFTNRAEFQRAGEGRAAILLDANSREADLNNAALSLFRRAASSGSGPELSVANARSFLRGRLTERHMLESEIQHVNVQLESGRRSGQYRPLQRGLGLRDSQVIDDIAFLVGMNARRAELHFGGEHRITFSENSGQFQVLETIRGISRYEFFETTGHAANPGAARFRGFTATAAGYEGFIRLATGVDVLNISGAVNTLDSSIDGLAQVHFVDGTGPKARGTFYERVAQRIVEIVSGEGVEMRNADGSARSGPRVTDNRAILGTEDVDMMNRVIERLENTSDAGGRLGERLYSGRYVIDTETGKAVEASEAGVRVVRETRINADGRSETVARVEADRGDVSAGRYRVIRRVINNETNEADIQAIVFSYREDGAIVVSNQRGLTGKNFQETGTVVLADPHVTTGELIQNLERVGRTKETGGGRFDARREIFLNREDIANQIEGAFSKQSIYRDLFHKRVANGLSQKSTETVMDAIFREIKNGGGTRAAIETVIDNWGGRDTVMGSRGLLRLSTELNLLARNSDVAKTVANEVFFHHDLGRALNEAFEAAGEHSNVSSKKILERFEEKFRNERNEAADELRQGNDVVSGKEQLVRISDGSRSRSEALLANFLRGEGGRLATPVRQILQRQLDNLIAARRVRVLDELTDVDAKRDSTQPMDDRSFANQGRGPDGFIESRRLVHERLGNDMAPAVEGGAGRPRQVVQAMRDLRAAGANETTVKQVEQIARDKGFTYRIGDVEYLNTYGAALVQATVRVAGLDGADEDRLYEVFARIQATGGPSLLAEVDGAVNAAPGAATMTDDERRAARAFAAVQVLADRGLLDLKKGGAREIDVLLSLGSTLAVHANAAVGYTVTQEDLKTLMDASIEGYAAMRDNFSGRPVVRAIIDQAQGRAPIAALLRILLDRAAPGADTGPLAGLVAAAERLQTTAQKYVDDFTQPGWMSTSPWAAPLRAVVGAIRWGVEHKKELAIGAGVVAGVAVLGGAGAILAGAATFAGLWAGLTATLSAVTPVAMGVFAVFYAATRRGDTANLAAAAAAIAAPIQKTTVQDLLDRNKGDIDAAVDEVAASRGFTAEQRSMFRQALSSLVELGEHAANARGRLTVRDLLATAGAAIVEGGRWKFQPTVTEAANKTRADFRNDFRRQLAQATKTRLPAKVQKALDLTATILQYGLMATPLIGNAGFVALGVGFVMKKALGKPSYLDGIASMAGGLAKKAVGASKDDDGDEKNLKEAKSVYGGTVWGVPALGWIGRRLLGVRGDPALNTVMAAHGASDIEAATNAIAEKKKAENTKDPLNVDDLISGKKDDKDAPANIVSLRRRLASIDGGSPVTAEQTLAALGFSKEESARVAGRADHPQFQARPEQLARISIDDLADLDEEAFAIRLGTMNFKWVKGELDRARNGLAAGAAVPDAEIDRIAAEAAVTPAEVRAVMTLTASRTDNPSVGDVQRAAHNDAGMEDFLFRALGWRPEIVRNNLRRITDAVKTELGAAAFNEISWALTRSLNVRDIGRSDDMKLDAVDVIGKVMVTYMRVYAVDETTGAPASIDGQKKILGRFLDTLSAYLGRSDDKTRERIADALRAAYGNPDFQQAPFVFGLDPNVPRSGALPTPAEQTDVIRDQLGAIRASVVIGDMAAALRSSPQANQIRAAYRALVNAPVDGRSTVADVLGAAGLSEALPLLPLSVSLHIVDQTLVDVIENLELARRGDLGPLDAPLPPVSPDEDDTASTLGADEPDAPPALVPPSPAASAATKAPVAPAPGPVQPKPASLAPSQPDDSIALTPAPVAPAPRAAPATADDAADVVLATLVQLHAGGAAGAFADASAIFTPALPIAGDDISDASRTSLWVVRGGKGDVVMIVAKDPDLSPDAPLRAVSADGWASLDHPPVAGDGKVVERYVLTTMGRRTTLHRVVTSSDREAAVTPGRPESWLSRTLVRLLPASVVRFAKPLLVLIALSLGQSALAGESRPAPRTAAGAVARTIVDEMPTVLTGGANKLTGAALTLALREDQPARAPAAPVNPVATSRDIHLQRTRLPLADGGSTELTIENVERVFGAADAMVAGGAEEGLYALSARRGTDGGIIVGEGRAVRTVRFEGVPPGGTSALRELARELGRVSARNPAAGASREAIANVRRLLNPDSGFGAWMGRLKAGDLLSAFLSTPEGQPFAEQFSTEIQALKDKAGPRGLSGLTLLDVLSLTQGNMRFQDLALQLVAFHAESVSAPGNVMIAGSSYRRLVAELGGVMLMHSHDGLLAPSFTDMQTANQVRSYERRNGIPSVDGAGIVAARGTDGKAVLIPYATGRTDGRVMTRDGVVNMKLPSAAPDSLVHFADDNEPAPGFLVSLLPAGLRTFLARRGWIDEGAQRVFDLSNQGDRAAADGVLSAVESLVDSGVSAGTIRSVWELSYRVADRTISPSSVEGFLSDDRMSRTDLANLVLQLSEQIRGSRRLMDAGANGQLMVLHRNVESFIPHQFGAVMAMPAEREWIIHKMGRLTLKVIDAKEAAVRAQALRLKIEANKDAATDELIARLIELTGLGTDGFRVKLRAAMEKSGVYAASPDVIAVILGNDPSTIDADQREKAQATAISLLLEPMVRAFVRSSRLTLEDEKLRQVIDSLTVTVVSRARLGNGLTGQAAVKETDILIALDPNLSGRDVLVEAVGLLAHELVHPFANIGLHAYDTHPFGIPSVLEEAWVQQKAGDMLRELGLDMAADLADLRTYDRIVKMKDMQAVYLVYGDDVKTNADSLKQMTMTSDGLNNVVVMAATQAEAAEAMTLFARSGVRVVMMDALLSIEPQQGNERLETDAELNLGTARVRLGLPESMLGKVMNSGDASVATLRRLVTPEGASGPALELLMPVRSITGLFERAIEARELAKQA